MAGGPSCMDRGTTGSSAGTPLPTATAGSISPAGTDRPSSSSPTSGTGGASWPAAGKACSASQADVAFRSSRFHVPVRSEGLQSGDEDAADLVRHGRIHPDLAVTFLETEHRLHEDKRRSRRPCLW